MKLKTTLLTICLVLFSWTGIQAQDTIPDLIISEAQFNTQGMNYIELTNMGDTAIDLSRFAVELFNTFPEYWINNSWNTRALRLDGSLAPGDSYVMSAVLEGLSGGGLKLYRPAMEAVSDRVVYPVDNLPPDSPVSDSISALGGQIFTIWGSRGAYAIRYFTPEGDSIIIDAVNHSMSPDNFQWDGLLSVAGVPEAALTHVFVRRHTITQGVPLLDHESNWDAARGTDISDSEWFPIPHHENDPEGIIYRTVGNHGDYHIDVQALNPSITIDLEAPSMTIPWGILRGDSIINELTLGDGMSWWYVENGSIIDSMHNICQTGDILTLYACGDVLEQKDFVLTVSAPATDMAKVFPISYKIYQDPADEIGVWLTPYYTTDDIPVIDTIGNVTFATRVDSLYKYLEKAPGASWEIVWVDGTERVDLMQGDILKVTSEDGTTVKDYFIDVLDYEANSNANLSAIVWPDINLDELWKINQGWTSQDTIPGFTSNVHSYTIRLPYGTNTVPVLNPIKANPNTKITTSRATSLSGGFDERTTIFTVTAEDDTTIIDYQVLFEVLKPADFEQPLYAGPIISEIVTRWYNRTGFIELYNPGNQLLDLSNYMVVAAGATSLPDVIQYDNTFLEQYLYYVPGYKYTQDTLAFETNGRFLELDVVDPVLDPGETFIIANWLDEEAENNDFTLAVSDLFFDDISKPPVVPNHWGMTFDRSDAVASTYGMTNAHYLYEIVGDSILDGTKAIGDPNDFVLLDVFGTYDDTPWNVGGVDCVINGKKKTNGWRYIRKSPFWHGNDDNLASFGTSDEDTEWIAEGSPIKTIDQSDLTNNIGSHALDPVTVHISTVSSLVFEVADGFEGSDLDIKGISNAETVQEFFDKLIKADTGQALVVTGADGVAKGVDDPVAENDTLTVTSAQFDNVTKYGLSLVPLDANTNLLAADGSGLTVDNATGTISGFDFGATVQSVFENIELESALSLINIVDTDGVLVPLKVARADGAYNSTVVGDEIIFEVVAQSGKVQEFTLTPNSLSSDAYVISDIFVVDNENARISMIHDGIEVSAFFTQIEIVTGATATLINKAGVERTLGGVKYDDQLLVVSEDGTVEFVYDFLFVNEMIINSPPVVTVEFTDAAINVGATLTLSASATDDGKPEPPSLTSTWEVTSGDAGNVTITDASQLSTDVTFSTEGTYTLTISVSDGELSSVKSVNVVVSGGVGIAGNQALQMNMYPNPAMNLVTFELQNMDPAQTTISIVDLSGRVVYNHNLTDGRTDIDISKFDAGIYHVSVRSGDNILNKKLSIVK